MIAGVGHLGEERRELPGGIEGLFGPQVHPVSRSFPWAEKPLPFRTERRFRLCASRGEFPSSSSIAPQLGGMSSYVFRGGKLSGSIVQKLALRRYANKKIGAAAGQLYHLSMRSP